MAKGAAAKTKKGKGRRYSSSVEGALKELNKERWLVFHELRSFVHSEALGDAQALKLSEDAMIRTRTYPVPLRMSFRTPEGRLSNPVDVVELGAPMLKQFFLLLREMASVKGAVNTIKLFGLAPPEETKEIARGADELLQSVATKVVAFLTETREEVVSGKKRLRYGRREPFEGTLADDRKEKSFLKESVGGERKEEGLSGDEPAKSSVDCKPEGEVPSSVDEILEEIETPSEKEVQPEVTRA